MTDVPNRNYCSVQKLGIALDGEKPDIPNEKPASAAAILTLVTVQPSGPYVRQATAGVKLHYTYQLFYINNSPVTVFLDCNYF